MVLTGLTSAICIMATSYKMLVIYVIIIGILDGSFIGLMSIVTFECCGNENMSHAWGGVLMCMSLTMLVGAPAGSKSLLQFCELRHINVCRDFFAPDNQNSDYHLH